MSETFRWRQRTRDANAPFWRKKEATPEHPVVWINADSYAAVVLFAMREGCTNKAALERMLGDV